MAMTVRVVTQQRNVRVTTSGMRINFASVNAALATADADININGEKIVNLGTPTADGDAATKAYVDDNAGGAVALDDLTDVTAPTPITNDVLAFSGTVWVNKDKIECAPAGVSDTAVKGTGGATSGVGVHGVAAGTGAGVRAENTGTGYALEVLGDTTSPVKAPLFIAPQDNVPSGVASLGEFFTDAAGVLWRCVTPGIPGVASWEPTNYATFAIVNAALDTADADINVNGQKIIGLGTPSDDGHAATKAYVDGKTSGTNTGDVTLTAVGSTPSADGASLSGQALTLQPADATHPGVVTELAQTFGGVKTFGSPPVMSGASISSQTVAMGALEEGGALTRIMFQQIPGGF